MSPTVSGWNCVGQITRLNSGQRPRANSGVLLAATETKTIMMAGGSQAGPSGWCSANKQKHNRELRWNDNPPQPMAVVGLKSYLQWEWREVVGA